MNKGIKHDEINGVFGFLRMAEPRVLSFVEFI